MGRQAVSEIVRSPAELVDAGSLAREVSVGVLSYRAWKMTARALRAHQASGLTRFAGEFFVFFNEMSAKDEELASNAGVLYFGSAQNIGIYGGFRAIAQRATRPYVLILENDILPLPKAQVQECLESCVADMKAHGITTFCLRSRSNPGQGGVVDKYIKCYDVVDPIAPELAPHSVSLGSKAYMTIKHMGIDRFRSTAIYVERNPQDVQPKAVRKLPSGNYLTDSRYRNWSNQSVLVERKFFLDVICRRVEDHPDPRSRGGHQDIECALNVRWWRRRREPLGHAAQGVFTHERFE